MMNNNIDNENKIIFFDNELNKNSNSKREILKGEKFLLLVSFIVAVLCDRLLFNVAINQIWNIFYFTAIFEICFTVIFCAVNYKKIYKKKYLWLTAGLIISLCVWNFIFDYASDYGILTFLVIPASLMMFTQLAVENLNLKNITGIIIAWFMGWIIKPFVAIHKCISVLTGFLFPKDKANKSLFIKITLAVIITVPLIVLLIFLLSGADKVFGYFVDKIFESFDIYDLILHGILIIIGFFIFYSFLWHGKYGESSNIGDKIKKEYKADNIILYIILSSVLILYILFCIIQFAYLFASAGLPDGISYSDYAREGFAQIVVISGINLIIFGCVIKFGKIHKPGEKDIVLKIMLYVLVAVTGIMLTSGFMRLGLYIVKEGMTFLRLISAWFMIYLVLVLILCVIRLIKAKLPLIVCCAILLLFSYNVLGYINPDAFITKHNLSKYEELEYNNKIDDWVEYAFNNLSDDAINVLLDSGLDKDKYYDIFEERYNNMFNKYNLSSINLKLKLEELFKSSESP